MRCLTYPLLILSNVYNITSRKNLLTAWKLEEPNIRIIFLINNIDLDSDDYKSISAAAFNIFPCKMISCVNRKSPTNLNRFFEYFHEY